MQAATKFIWNKKAGILTFFEIQFEKCFFLLVYCSPLSLCPSRKPASGFHLPHATISETAEQQPPPSPKLVERRG